MRLGVRAHDFGKQPVEELAKKIGGKGFSSIQLALNKAIDGIDYDNGRLSPGLANHIYRAFDRYDIQIAVLGCYINPVHPDSDIRRSQLDRFKEHIRYARDFGSSIVATETGSLNADFSYNPENHGERDFKMLLESLKELAEEAEKFGVIVGLEGVSHYTMNNTEKIARTLDQLGSNNVQVVFDPVNLLTADNYRRQEEVVEEAFRLFGNRMAAFHAKDFVAEGDKLKVVQAGEGSFNYEYTFGLLKERKPFIDILMENARLDIMDRGMEFLRERYYLPSPA